MFGRIRASPVSSLENFECSPPSKILKDDSFSIYEATLMKLKLGAKRDTFSMQMDEEEFTKDCSVTDEAKMDVDFTPATASDDDGKVMLMDADADCSSSITTTVPSISSFSDGVSTENNSEQPWQNNVSILRFFKVMDHSGRGEANLSVKKCSYGSVSSSGSVESNGTTSELCE